MAKMVLAMGDIPTRVFIIAGEVSGDELGLALMQTLIGKSDANIEFRGVGGSQMERIGLKSIFDMEDVAVMGFSAVIMRLPLLVRRINQTAQAAIDWRPDMVILIDSPGFTHRVARKIRARLPDVPIVDYVCPSVWAWDPSRAKKMTDYVDHVLTILPFEPRVLRDLGGPPATYVGHPIVEAARPMRQTNGERKSLLVLPGSRKGEITRLMPAFKEALEVLATIRSDFDVTLPAVERHVRLIKDNTYDWPVPVNIVTGDKAKMDAFAGADAALTASGTVCLELALSGVPMISTYKLDPVARQLRFLVTAWTANLPNLIIDYPAVPEYIDEFVRPPAIARSLSRLLDDTPERASQVESFANLADIMTPEPGVSAAEKAADVVLSVLEKTGDKGR
ncbi:MAG: lipid-A-disaccharide synthase [Pseudomonadota bacterium]